jgi:hypothetical protein
VYAAGPRIEPSFLEDVVRLDDPALPIAETYRRIRLLAEETGIPRPSYERIRIHVVASRAGRAERARALAQAGELLLHLAFNSRRANYVIADLLALVA